MHPRVFRRRRYDGKISAMIRRRFTKFAVASLVVLCLWWTFRLKLVVVLPLLQHYVRLKPSSRIAKATVAVNSLNTPLIQKALSTHMRHNDLHNYRHHITTVEVVGDLSENDPQHRPRGAWSKPALLLSIIVAELAKSESERLDWILYVDGLVGNYF